jgi:RHS repeat-associated protein
MSYWPATLQIQQVLAPTKASVSYRYDDALTMAELVHAAAGTIVSERYTSLNGLGLPRRVTSHLGDGNYNLVDTRYNASGQLWRQTRPYLADGRTSQWSETFYDALGRVTHVLAPDGSETRAFYNEAARPYGASPTPGQTLRTVDAWGRERWTRSDALGRVVEVFEPNPAGRGVVSEFGTIATFYDYNVLGLATRVLHGQMLPEAPPLQLREFRYDSLGRLTHQYLPEKLGTLNDAGVYGQPGAHWSDIFAYDERGNLTSHTDARGVKTIYDYAGDPLNRLQAVRYDTSSVGDTSSPVAPAGDVNYTYMPTGNLTRLQSVTTAGVGAETYGYDAEGRLSAKTLTLTSLPNNQQLIEYGYDSLGRLTDMRYPAAYALPGDPRKLVHYNYGRTVRLQELQVDGVDYASGIAYNAAGQVTALSLGANGSLQLNEQYNYDEATGLLTRQQVHRAGVIALDLSYDYMRPGTSGGRTSQLTKMTNHLDSRKNRTYTYDALGRLTSVVTGEPFYSQFGFLMPYRWKQDYSYDAYGNRTGVKAYGPLGPYRCQPDPQNPFDPCPPPPPPPLPDDMRDGLAAVSYDPKTNRITSAGFAYDAAGNLTRSPRPDGTWQRFQYDAAGRLAKVTDDAGAPLEIYTYGASRHRLATQYGDTPRARMYYAWDGDRVIAEYTEIGTFVSWAKSYFYLGDRLLTTVIPGSGGTDVVQFYHPDRLGSRLVSNGTDATSGEQVTLPFGVTFKPETTIASNRRFTSYDRSTSTGQDYAVNRFYEPQQGRFTQADPLGMGAVDPLRPQSLNLYAYVGNDPVNAVDPDGLKWKTICRGSIELDDGSSYDADCGATWEPDPADDRKYDDTVRKERGQGGGGGGGRDKAERKANEAIDKRLHELLQRAQCLSEKRPQAYQALQNRIDATDAYEAARLSLGSAKLSLEVAQIEIIETGMGVDKSSGMKDILVAPIARGKSLAAAEAAVQSADISFNLAKRTMQRADNDARSAWQAMQACNN